MIEVTAVLLNWKRPDNLRDVIIPSLLEHDFIREIRICDNAGDFRCDLPRTFICMPKYPHANLGPYGRYVTARKCSTDLIFTQDDDFRVDNVEAIYHEALARPDDITLCMDKGHVAYGKKHYQFGDAEMGLVGWGAMFRKKHLEVFRNYTERYGWDDLLLSKADRIFTMLQNRKHNILLAKGKMLPGSTGHESMYRQPDHQRLIREAQTRCQCILAG